MTTLRPVFRRTKSSAPALRYLFVIRGMYACLGFYGMMNDCDERPPKAFDRQSQATVLATCVQDLCGSQGDQACPASPFRPGFCMTVFFAICSFAVASASTSPHPVSPFYAVLTSAANTMTVP
jgi:hypothetical protein